MLINIYSEYNEFKKARKDMFPEDFAKKYESKIESLNNANSEDEINHTVDQIISSNEFDEYDFSQISSWLFEKSKTKDEHESIICDAFYQAIVSTRFDKYYKKWNKNKFEEYKEFFIKEKPVFFLEDFPKSLLNYYKDFFNWKAIIHFSLELVNDYVLNETFDIFEEYEYSMFSNDKPEPYVAGTAEQFFLLYMEGVRFSHKFIKNSIMNNSTTFSNYIIEKNLLFKFTDYKQFSTPIGSFEHEIQYGNNNKSSKVIPLEPIFSRLFNDEEFVSEGIIGFEEDEDEYEDDDLDDDLGF